MALDVDIGRQNRVGVAQIRILAGQRRHAAVLQERAVVGLLVLAPADVADPARVVENQLAAADGRREPRDAAEAQAVLVDFGAFGIGNDRIVRLRRRVIVDQRRRVLHLDERAQRIPRLRRVAEARAQGQRIGVLERIVLLHRLVAQAHVQIDLAAGDRGLQIRRFIGGLRRRNGQHQRRRKGGLAQRGTHGPQDS
jgi:hypothetical protein